MAPRGSVSVAIAKLREADAMVGSIAAYARGQAAKGEPLDAAVVLGIIYGDEDAGGETGVRHPRACAPANARVFAGRPESVRQARAWVTSFVPGSPAADDIALMTSELVTNAIRHSGSGLPGGVVVVSVRTGKNQIRVDVFDQGELPPGIGAQPGMGAGLEIVSQLSDMFGATGSDRWFSLCTGGAR